MDEQEVGFDPNAGQTDGLYYGESPSTVWDPFASYQTLPDSVYFSIGIEESRA
jgi:hypothetical protein